MERTRISYESQITDFKKTIAYDGLLKPTPGWVLVHWSEETAGLPAFALWKTRSFERGVSPSGESLIDWILEKEGVSFALCAHWYPAGAEAAQNAMFNRAVENTLGYSLYAPGPNLGDVCLAIRSMKDAKFLSILWCHANVFFRLDGLDGEADVLPLARQLQEIIAKHTFTSIANSRPMIETVKCSNIRPFIGDKFFINIKLVARENSTEEIFRAHCDTEFIAYEKTMNLDSLEFSAIRPGKTEIQVFIVDRDTLVSTKAVIPIDIQPLATP